MLYSFESMPVVTAGLRPSCTSRRVAGLECVFGADPSADLDAGVGSGNVEEPGAVDATNLHVFDRFGLNGKIGSLCPATATRPAAEPRRRLFTIFIVTSKFV
jgi:hypothetical protein